MKRAAIVIFLLLIGAGDLSMQHIQLTKAQGESEFPDLAWNGSRLATAWMDGRDGNLEIYVKTANFQGLSAGENIRITNSATWDDQPHLTWTGAGYGLVYIHESKSRFDLMFLALNEDLRPKGKAKAIVRQEWLGKETDVCWTGAGYGLVYSKFDNDSTSQIVFQYVDESGNKQGAPVTLTSGAGVKVPTSFVRNGSDFGLFYLDASAKNAYYLRIDPFGNPRSLAQKLNLDGTQAGGGPSAAVAHNVTVVSWPQDMVEGQQIMVLTLSSADAPLGPPVPVSSPGPSRPSNVMASGPDGFGLAWVEITEEGRTVYFVGLDPTGKPSCEPLRISKPRPIKVMGNQLDMIRDDVGYVIAWVDVVPPMNTEVILSRVNY